MPGDPLAAHQSISINDIANADLIMLKEGSFLRQLVLSKIKRANIAEKLGKRKAINCVEVDVFSV